MVTIMIGLGISFIFVLPAFVIYCACISAARLDKIVESAQIGADH